MNKKTKIYIAGHRGMVGSAVRRALEEKGYTNLLGKKSSELDLRNQQAVDQFYSSEKPEVVIDAAAKVGGILANNDYPYPFLKGFLVESKAQKLLACPDFCSKPCTGLPDYCQP